MTDGVPWHRVEEVFDYAIELSGDARAAYLDDACAGQPELREEVEGLLRSATDLEGYLEEPAAARFSSEVRAALDEFDPFPRTSRRVGVYDLLEPVGRGGMGRVFRATRADGVFDHEVAVKVLRWELASGPALMRFERERRLLARLEHPGIARIIDGGRTDDGLPYLVMEFVSGVPILQHCEEAGAGLPERLDLFRAVCDVVDYAHQLLVVHRDLKSSNILVTPDGDVKLLDFGIAKLLDEGETSTRPGDGTPLTPGNAAPEQIRGEPISTATDVHALGTLLYQLLTGHHPHAADSPTVPELTRRIVQEDPSPPSRAIGQGLGSAAPVGWRTAVRGDLDAITLKALARDPHARYRSVRELADDVSRHQRHLPVHARSGAKLYATRRFVRRHRVGIAAGSAVVIALLAGIVGTATQARKATAEAERAERVANVVLGLFEFTDPLGNPNVSEVRPEDLIDRGLAIVENEFVDDPVTRDRMLQWIGEAYVSAGARMKGREILTRTLEENRLRGDRDAEARAVHALSTLAVGDLRLEAAVELAEYELTLLGTLGLGSSHRAAAALAVAAEAIQNTEPDSALRLIATSRDLRVSAESDTSDMVLSLDAREAAVLWRLGRTEAAEALYADVIDRWFESFPDGHPGVSSPLNNLAVIQRRAGRVEEAIETYRRSLSILEEYGGRAHPITRRVRGNLASALAEVGDRDAALRLYAETVEALRTEHPDRLLEIGRATETVANAQLVFGAPDSAVARYAEAIGLYEETGPDAALVSALAELRRSVALHTIGDRDTGEAAWRRGAAYLERPGGGSLNGPGRGVITWVAGRYEEMGEPELARRAWELEERLRPVPSGGAGETGRTGAPRPDSTTPEH